MVYSVRRTCGYSNTQSNEIKLEISVDTEENGSDMVAGEATPLHLFSKIYQELVSQS